jgi:hypothetical protein
MWPSLRIGFRTGGLLRLKIALVTFSTFLLSCDNQFKSFSNLTEDDALFYTALDAVNDGSFDDAIAACSAMTPGYADGPKVVYLCATAYAGRCGFNTTTMLGWLAPPPTAPIFNWFVQTAITSTTAQSVSDCSTAMGMLETLGVAATRSEDENLFMTLLAIQTIAVVANEYGDITEGGGTDAGFDPCDGVTDLTDANAQIVAAAFWNLNKSLDILTDTTNSYDTFYTTIDGVCTTLAGLGQNLCAEPDSVTITGNPLKGARTLLAEGAAIGLNPGVCGGGNFATCNCP